MLVLGTGSLSFKWQRRSSFGYKSNWTFGIDLSCFLVHVLACFCHIAVLVVLGYAFECSLLSANGALQQSSNGGFRNLYLRRLIENSSSSFGGSSLFFNLLIFFFPFGFYWRAYPFFNLPLMISLEIWWYFTFSSEKKSYSFWSVDGWC